MAICKKPSTAVTIPMILSALPNRRTVMEQVRMVARTDTPVLLFGETGIGNEQLARAIHEFSDRSAAIMVKVNCAGAARRTDRERIVRS